MAVPDDPASVLEYFINDVANLPAEIAHLYEEMEAKERLIHDCRTVINSKDASLQKFIKAHTSLVVNPKEKAYEAIILQNYDRAIQLQVEKERLAVKASKLVLLSHFNHRSQLTRCAARSAHSQARPQAERPTARWINATRPYTTFTATRFAKLHRRSRLVSVHWSEHTLAPTFG